MYNVWNDVLYLSVLCQINWTDCSFIAYSFHMTMKRSATYHLLLYNLITKLLRWTAVAISNEKPISKCNFAIKATVLVFNTNRVWHVWGIF